MVATRTMMPYAAVLAAALTLGACSGGDPAAPSWVSTANGGTTTSGSSGATASSGAPATSAAPTAAEDPVLAKIPKEARAETPKGAEAFVMFYMKQVNQAFTKADSSVLESLSKPGCNMCQAFIESTTDLASRKVHHKGLSIDPSAAKVQQYDLDAHSVLVWTTQHSVPVVNETGDRVDQTKAGKGILLATLLYEDQRWWVKRLQVAK